MEWIATPWLNNCKALCKRMICLFSFCILRADGFIAAKLRKFFHTRADFSQKFDKILKSFPTPIVWFLSLFRLRLQKKTSPEWPKHHPNITHNITITPNMLQNEPYAYFLVFIPKKIVNFF